MPTDPREIGDPDLTRCHDASQRPGGKRTQLRRSRARPRRRGARLRHAHQHQGHGGGPIRGRGGRADGRADTPSRARPGRPQSTPPSPWSTRSPARRSSPPRSPTWARSPRSSTKAPIPVFADIDPVTGNVTADVGRRRPLRSHACDHRHAPVRQPVPIWTGSWRSPHGPGVPVIEDSAQAYLAADARRAGRHGRRLRLFSLAAGQAHHLGEGGFVVTDDADARPRGAHLRQQGVALRRAQPRPRVPRPELPDHRAAGRGRARPAAPSSTGNVAHRRAIADRARRGAGRRRGHHLPGRRAGRRARLLAVLRSTSIATSSPVVPTRSPRLCVRRASPSAPRYIQKPAFRCRVFAEQNTFGDEPLAVHACPAGGGRLLPERFPGTFAFLDSVLVLPLTSATSPSTSRSSRTACAPPWRRRGRRTWRDGDPAAHGPGRSGRNRRHR